MRVQVRMAPGNQYASAFVEVMGRVAEDGSLEEIQSFDLGDNFGGCKGRLDGDQAWVGLCGRING